MWLLIAALTSPTVASSQDLQPADPELVEGPKLQARRWNFSIEAPTPQWRWFTASRPRHHAFVCLSPDGDIELRIGAFEGFSEKISRESATQFAAGAVSSLEKAGWQETKLVEMDGASIPMPGSFRFVIKGRREGAPLRVYAYLASRGRTFTFQHITPEDTEPAVFQRFVSSFVFEGTPPADPLEALGHLHLMGTGALTLLLGSCGWAINKSAGRMVINMWKVTVVVLLLSGIALSVYWLPRLPSQTTPYRSGQFFGRVVMGPVLFPLLFAVWRSRAFARRRLAEPGDTRIDVF
jgi:hypothetical protein